jgi:putative acetyltransferase
MHVRQMVSEDIEAALAFWGSFDGVQLNEGDTLAGVGAFLERNPGISFVATVGGQTVGAVLAGHDGRRGFLYHLAVDAAHRRQGIGQALVREAVRALREAGIPKCHVMVFRNNHSGTAFWNHLAWRKRDDIDLHTLAIERGGE